MTIDETIKHAEEVAEENDKLSIRYDMASRHYRNYNEVFESMYAKRSLECFECAEEHRQLAAWLKELKQLREQTRYISVSESLPKNEQEVLFRTKQGNIHQGIYYSDNKWYSRTLSTWIYFDSILEWMPLPEPYKESEE